MISTTPIIIAIIPFIMGAPGALIHHARLGLRNAPSPNKVTITPAMRSIIFVIPMVSTLILLLFHMQVFLLHHP